MPIFAVTYEQAQDFVPSVEALFIPFAVAKAPFQETILIASGERVPTSRYWLFESRRDFGLNFPSRSWKRHRRTQRGNIRI